VTHAYDYPGTGTVEGFAINSGTGALTAIPGSPFDACTNNDGSYNDCRSGLVDPSGHFLIAMQPWETATIHIRQIDQTTGALSGGSDTPATSGAFGGALATLDGTTYLLVNNVYDASVSVYTFNPNSGAISPVSGQPFTFNSWEYAHYLSLDPSGRFGYVVDFGTDCCDAAASTITGVTLNSSGNPVQIPGSPFSNGTNAPTQIVITH
jgi:hypothetical protein